MLKHIEPFHLNELSDKGFKYLCKYVAKKGLIAYQMLPDFEDKDFRTKATEEVQGRLLLSLGDLLEFIDTRVEEGPYNIKRNFSRTSWTFDHEEIEINTSQSPELISVLWNIAKTLFEEGDKSTS